MKLIIVISLLSPNIVKLGFQNIIITRAYLFLENIAILTFVLHKLTSRNKNNNNKITLFKVYKF